jgi:hypothetical protein
MWFNLAAGNGKSAAAKGGDDLEHSRTRDQIAEAQQRTAAWQPIRSKDRQPASPPTAAPITKP